MSMCSIHFARFRMHCIHVRKFKINANSTAYKRKHKHRIIRYVFEMEMRREREENAHGKILFCIRFRVYNE